MQRAWTIGVMAGALWLCTACDSATGGPDAATMDAGEGADADTCGCDDGLFCNGVELCESGACVPGSAPCGAGACDEAADQCGDDDCSDPDADDDGHDRLACGGDDCDDGDGNRYPGNLETCDAHDEDCDDNTLGPDMDGDGSVSESCCNPGADGAPRCGDDCDDTRSTTNPGGSDGCGAGDEDCDGRVDEEPSIEFFLDADGDSYGSGEPVLACSSPSPSYAARGGDCADDPTIPGAASIFPNAAEQCNQLDDDCDSSTDEGLSCSCDTPGATRSCGVTRGECVAGTETCMAGTYQGCDAIEPTDDDCNGLDDDCDGSTDEGVTVGCYVDQDDDGDGDMEAALGQYCSCGEGLSPNNDDCDDGDPFINNNASTVERCNGVDDDCNGTPDDDASFTCAHDQTSVPCSVSCNLFASAPGSRTCNTCQLGSCVVSTSSEAQRGLCDGVHDNCDGVIDDGCLSGVGKRQIFRHRQQLRACPTCPYAETLYYRFTTDSSPPAVSAPFRWVYDDFSFWLHTGSEGGQLTPMHSCRRNSDERFFLTTNGSCPSGFGSQLLGYGWGGGSTILVHTLTDWNHPHPLYVLTRSGQNRFFATASPTEYEERLGNGWVNPDLSGGSVFAEVGVLCDGAFEVSGPGGAAPCLVGGVFTASPSESFP